MSRQTEIQAEIGYHNRRLQILKERVAKEGGGVDPAVRIEIEDIQEKITTLEGELDAIEQATPYPIIVSDKARLAIQRCFEHRRNHILNLLPQHRHQVASDQLNKLEQAFFVKPLDLKVIETNLLAFR